jgi:GT2 family glycosyltransferase
MAKLGLVTVLYKGDDVLEDFIISVSNQTFADYHLYIIDNSPSENTDQLLNKLLAKYPVTAYTHIKNAGNYGVAKGNNQGIELSLQQGAEYVILLNNDIVFDQPDLLDQMVRCAEEKGEHMIVPKIFYYGTDKIWTAGGKFIYYKGTSKGIGDKQPDSEKYSVEKHFDYAPTCFMLISRKVFETIGLMDEQYFVYYDDDDFVYRAIKKGFEIYLLPRLKIFHKESFSTGGYESLFSIHYLNRNRVYFINKNFSFPIKYIALTQMLLTKAIRYLQYDKSRKQTLFKSIKEGFGMKPL